MPLCYQKLAEKKNDPLFVVIVKNGLNENKNKKKKNYT